jgi:CCR4-NOT transcription complex subunit 1
MFMTILNPTSESGDDLTPAYLASLIDRLLQNPPRNWNEESQSNLNFSVRARYEKLALPLPSEVMSTMQLAELTGPSNDLVRLVQRTGERATASLESCKDMLAGAETRHINYTQVATVLLFMVITQNGEAYNPAIFVQALKEHRAGRRLDWQDVVHSFDRESLVISKQQFLSIYRALLPLAQEYENFDIQLLWGGQWNQIDTQLSFVVAFLSCTDEELNAAEIPRLRRAYVLESFEDASAEVREYAAQAIRHPLVSLDATSALFKMIFQNQDTYKHAIALGIPELVINPHTPYFVVASAAVPQPWGGLQDQAFDQLFLPFLRKQLDGYSFVFHGLWKQDSQWLAERLVKYHNLEPLSISYIYDHSLEHGWLQPLTTIPNEFGLDLACYAHGHGQFDIEAWLQEAHTTSGLHFPTALAAFVEEKARADIITQKEAGAPIQTAPLMIDTAYVLLSWLGQVLPEDILISLNRVAIGAYPRLINYGEGFDAIIKEDSKNGNAISPEADGAMQEHFKGLYNRETDVKSMIEALQSYKNSEDPQQQELFACMIQGLFDEYSCFGEYPPDALATTAVLFGSIINFNLLSSIALQAGLSMVLEALQTSTSREDKMYKFGLQALIHFQSKLVEWPRFCEKLIQIPDLQGTEVFRTADEIVRNRMGAEMNGETSTNGITNGVTEEITGEASAPFTSLNVDPPLRPELYQEPDEEIQDRVIFAVNNLSDRNIDEKFKDIQEAVTDQYHQWFALHLVEDRAKSQPNYHDLFLKLLRLFNSNWLWKEVIRETIVTCVRLLNADATLNNANDRNQLKNLGNWLGHLTLARDKPILHRNIAFVELLVEAYKSKRLMVVIPFVCRVLKAVANSKTFAPPNPWTEEILKILLEMYHHVEMKIQLKFEVEVLCKDIGADIKKIEPSVIIRESDFPYDTDFPASVPDGLEGFNDLTLANFSRQNTRLGDRFSPTAIINSLPDISNRLFLPPLPTTNAVTAEQTRSIFLQAAELAIREIIFPVVERSVTIAGISASNLVTKDFATEPDEEKFRKAAHSMVKSLAGSLALVTCREPLRMSMTNNVRNLSRSLPGEGMAEGVILMFVNDNIDVVCKVVEEAAERQSIAVIDEATQESLLVRAQHRTQSADEPFQWPAVHRFARMMPEPFKPSDGNGGLTPSQLAIYENFGPTRTGVTHGAGQDSRAQLPDLDIANLPTPAGEPAIPRQALQPSRGPGDAGEARINGYANVGNPDELLQEIFELAKNAPDESWNDLPPTAPVREAISRLVRSLPYIVNPGSYEMRAGDIAWRMLQVLLSGRLDRRIEVDAAAQVLFELGVALDVVAQQVWASLNEVNDEALLANPKASIALLTRRFVNTHRIDAIITNGIMQHEPRALSLLSELLDAVVFNDLPLALRADFANSIEALSHVVSTEPNHEAGRVLLARLNNQTPDNAVMTPPATKQDEHEHIFETWISLISKGVSETQLVGYVKHLHDKQVLKDPEASTQFFRTCIDLSITTYETEEENYGQLDNAYLPIDALAQLIATVVLYQGEPEGAVKPTKSAYLDHLLAAIVAIHVDHIKQRGEHANHKIFFRLYSDLFYEFHRHADKLGEVYDEIVLVFAHLLVYAQPKYMPGFAFSWLSLVSHRFFMMPILRAEVQQRVSDSDHNDGVGESNIVLQGSDAYVSLMEIVLKNANPLLPTADNQREAAAYIAAILRTLLILHHDFPDFLIENHARLCAAAPAKCSQIRNLISHVSPQGLTVPDPFANGLQLERMEEMRQSPVLKIDLVEILDGAGLKGGLDVALKNKSRNFGDIVDTLNDFRDSAATIQAVALYVGTEAIATAGSKSQIFNKSTAHFALLQALANGSFQLANNLFNAMVNQLRYPNAHTYWFCQALLEIFAHPAEGSDEAKHTQVRETIAAVLLERLMPMRPHPWGLVVTFMELVKNQDYDFQNLPFVREHEEVWTRPRGLEALSAPGLPPPGMSGF